MYIYIYIYICITKLIWFGVCLKMGSLPSKYLKIATLSNWNQRNSNRTSCLKDKWPNEFIVGFHRVHYGFIMGSYPQKVKLHQITVSLAIWSNYKDLTAKLTNSLDNAQNNGSASRKIWRLLLAENPWSYRDCHWTIQHNGWSIGIPIYYDNPQLAHYLE